VKTGMVGGVGMLGIVEERDTDVEDGDEVVVGIAVQLGRVKVPLKEPEPPYTMQLFFRLQLAYHVSTSSYPLPFHTLSNFPMTLQPLLEVKGIAETTHFLEQAASPLTLLLSQHGL
jgi:hypothetical protein